MGASLSALEVYRRLHLWESVIACYQTAGRTSQAERVIRERMEAEGESVLLWCLLGDTTQVRREEGRRRERHGSLLSDREEGVMYDAINCVYVFLKI